jgi:hypothetical protein
MELRHTTHATGPEDGRGADQPIPSMRGTVTAELGFIHDGLCSTVLSPTHSPIESPLAVFAFAARMDPQAQLLPAELSTLIPVSSVRV